MSVLVLTGPPACGKNTIAEALGKRLKRCAVVDVDSVRRMVVSPAALPWEGEDGTLGRELGIRNASALIRNFEENDFDTVVVDVLSDDLAELYRKELDGIDLYIVLLLPTEDEVNARLLSRPDYLSQGEVSWLYAQQSQFEGYNDKLDNTMLSPEQAAQWVIEHWTPAHA